MSGSSVVAMPTFRKEAAAKRLVPLPFSHTMPHTTPSNYFLQPDSATPTQKTAFCSSPEAESGASALGVTGPSSPPSSSVFGTLGMCVDTASGPIGMTCTWLPYGMGVICRGVELVSMAVVVALLSVLQLRMCGQYVGCGVARCVDGNMAQANQP